MKIPKDDVNYRAGSQIRRCGNCVMFRRSQIGRPGSCTIIAGIIYAKDVCDRWVKK